MLSAAEMIIYMVSISREIWQNQANQTGIDKVSEM